MVEILHQIETTTVEPMVGWYLKSLLGLLRCCELDFAHGVVTDLARKVRSARLRSHWTLYGRAAVGLARARGKKKRLTIRQAGKVRSTKMRQS